MLRADGVDIATQSRATLGPHIGYLPQSPSLFAGMVAENIARLEAEPDGEAVVAAAKAAGVHELILRLPKGYDTVLGEEGAPLSSGQRQRLGLARALYGNPSFLVLDEPNANLDADGEVALVKAIAAVRARGGTVIVIAHRPSAIASLDRLMVLRDGRVFAFGPKDEILAKVLARPVDGTGRPGGLTVVAEGRG